MNIPNLLTLLRIFFVPLLVAALLAENFGADLRAFVPMSQEMFALGVFLIAAATDLLDGYLARRWGQITTVGTLLDPIADKLLVLAALVSLVQIHRVSAWMAILIMGREFAVSGLRSIAAAEGYVIQAGDLGKTKMAAQVIAIALVIAGIRWPQFETWGSGAMWVVLAFGVISAADYFRKFWHKVDGKVKLRRRRELLDMERQKKRLARAEARGARPVREGGLRSQRMRGKVAKQAAAEDAGTGVGAGG
ncbi:MAG: CDP-diacylglycerol--glycerol-3-phosphate 3-phosphatidyltransferase [Acidobacteriota bacterium]